MPRVSEQPRLVQALPASGPRRQSGGDRRWLCDRPRTCRILPLSRSLGRALRNPLRNPAVQHLLSADLRPCAPLRHLRLPQLLQAASRSGLAAVRARISAVRRAHPRRLWGSRWRNRSRGVRRPRMGRHGRAHGRDRRRRRLRQQGGGAPVSRRLLLPLRHLRGVHRSRALEVRGRRFRAASHNIRKPPGGRSPALRISATTSSARSSSCRCSATSPATATRLSRGSSLAR